MRHTDAFVVRYVAGFGTKPSDVPSQLKQAVMMICKHLFDNPDAVLSGTISKEIEFGVRELVSSNSRCHLFW